VDGELYPRLEWTSSIDSIAREGTAFEFKGKEQVTVRINPAIRFQFDRIEVFGRLGEGQKPRQLSEDELNLSHIPRSRTSDLMDAVVPLADAAAATGAAVPYDAARVLARWPSRPSRPRSGVRGRARPAACFWLAKVASGRAGYFEPRPCRLSMRPSRCSLAGRG
jgi:hypothetical protein